MNCISFVTNPLKEFITPANRQNTLWSHLKGLNWQNADEWVTRWKQVHNAARTKGALIKKVYAMFDDCDNGAQEADINQLARVNE